MKYRQEAYERETIIHFTDADSDVNFYTANPRWIRKLDKLVEEHPENFREVKRETYQGEVIAKDYAFPSRFLSIRSKDIKRSLTDKQKQVIAERLKRARISGTQEDTTEKQLSTGKNEIKSYSVDNL